MARRIRLYKRYINRFKKDILNPPLSASTPPPSQPPPPPPIPPKPSKLDSYDRPSRRDEYVQQQQQQQGGESVLFNQYSPYRGGDRANAAAPRPDDEYFDEFRKVNDYKHIEHIGRIDDQVTAELPFTRHYLTKDSPLQTSIAV